jgi:hypothetical protein
MKKHQKFFLALIIILMAQSIGAELYTRYKQVKIDKLKKEIEQVKDDNQKIFGRIEKQKRDSIAVFDKTNANMIELNKLKQEKQNLQKQVAQIVEQSWREYRNANYSKYCAYIDSCFTEKEIAELSHYVGVAHFTLSCDIDCNYFKTLDDILYGPYWHEFAEFVRSKQHNKSLIKKYERVRRNAESIYPYIYIRSVFYDAGSIAKNYKDTITQTDIIFTDAIKSGREYLCDSVYKSKPVQPEYMTEFNRLRNVSKIFTTDLYMLIESLFLCGDENVDLNAPLFSNHYNELFGLVQHIIDLTPKIKTCTSQHDTDIKSIETYFQDLRYKKYDEANKKLENLKIELDSYNTQNEH